MTLQIYMTLYIIPCRKYTSTAQSPLEEFHTRVFGNTDTAVHPVSSAFDFHGVYKTQENGES